MIFPSILFFFFVTLFSLFKNNKGLACFCLISVLYTLVLFSFYVSVNSGTPDYLPYYLYFKSSPSIFSPNFISYSQSTHTEIGYDSVQAFIKSFSNSATLFFWIICFTSLVFRYNFYSFFFKHKSDLCILFFAFFAHEFLRKDCIQIRNGIASAIVLYSLKYLYKKQRIEFMIFVLIAATFQSTALMAFPLIIVQKRQTKIYNKFLIFIFIVSFIFSLFISIKKILQIFQNFGFLPDAVILYLGSSQYSRPLSITNPVLLKQIIISCFFFYRRKKYFDDEQLFFFFQVYLVSTVYYLVFRDFEILAGRFGSLFYGIEPLLLLRTVYLTKKNIFIKKLYLCFFYLCFFILNILTNTYLTWNPQIV